MVPGHRGHDALAEHGQGTRSGTARARLSPGEALRPQPGWRRQAEPLGLWSWPRKGRRLLQHIPVPTFHSHQQDEVTPAATTHPLGPVAPDGAEQSSVGTSASPEPKALLESPAQGCHGQGMGTEGGQQDCTPHPRHILWGQNPSPCIPERGRRRCRGTAGQSHPGPRQLLPSEGNHRAAGSQQGTGCGGAQAPLSPAAHPNPMGQGSHPVAIWDKNTKIRESSGAFALAAARSPAQVS